MPITATRIEVAVRYTFLGQDCQNIQWFFPSGAALLTATATGLAEAYWNEVKTVWRALVPSSSAFTFNTVFLREDNGGLSYGEYAIPPAERDGTRDPTGLGDFLPPANAASVRLAVGTAVTRPGQKRFPGILEGDSTGSLLSTAFVTLVDALAEKYDTPLIMGAPVATALLTPIIVRKAGTPPVVVADQAVTGHVTNNVPKTQVSRRA